MESRIPHEPLKIRQDIDSRVFQEKDSNREKDGKKSQKEKKKIEPKKQKENKKKPSDEIPAYQKEYMASLIKAKNSQSSGNSSTTTQSFQETISVLEIVPSQIPEIIETGSVETQQLTMAINNKGGYRDNHEAGSSNLRSFQLNSSDGPIYTQNFKRRNNADSDTSEEMETVSKKVTNFIIEFY
jgi:hypothetical protein